ncbi:uncharacterized protein RHOBADRAFT_46249 [Rhodotorula graminis WP1]|uniref:SH3 domain-containing protein n=1 Tax=Rhodotorula graminis (strain WP1) TaxID=578459 RepID=A0A0P9EIH7_RHOGW|nr:uncharacterized protein RHOBADRAFT_46249 [Rhodotorula graminis WP1]KPV73144.1 hypothetical protein RHOBADRAFT_46249 [Rhodotorula graminis WP1]
MATPSSHALTQHLLSRLEADLAFLNSQQLLSASDLDLIRSKLAPIHAQQSLAALSVTGPSGSYGQQQQRVPPPPPVRAAQPPPRDLCRAVWDYAGGQADDLSFRQGDVISVDEEVNADWWKGTLNGRTGLFPRNHVERISSPSASPALAPPAPAPAPLQGHHTGSSASWAPPAPSSATVAPASFAYQQPQQYGEKNSYYGAGGPPPPPAPVAQPPVAPPKKQHKFAKQMGTAMASGAGFGVGASLASEAVHAIF